MMVKRSRPIGDRHEPLPVGDPTRGASVKGIAVAMTSETVFLAGGWGTPAKDKTLRIATRLVNSKVKNFSLD